MLESFKLHIQKKFPFIKGSRLLVACSGGLDSIVLSVIFHKLEFDFALVHCNFKLRGKESDTDERFVVDFSKKIGVELYVKQFETKKEIEKRGGSTQMVARDLRYKWFQELLETRDYDYVLTAHHADDSLETFIINLSRGTGIEGLTGIPSQNENILRPLLSFSRSEILAFAESNQLSWREDSSNAESKYLRNQIRHNIVPKLKELNPEFLSNFLNTQLRLQESSVILENTKRQLQNDLFVVEGDFIKVSIYKLQELKPLSPYLYLLFNEYGFTAWTDIFNLINATSGKEVRSSSHRLIKDRDFLLLTSISKINNSEFLISEDQVRIEKPIKLEIELVKTISDTHKNMVYADMEKLNFPLLLRKWSNGDYFYPLGMKGKKKVSKYLKDEKVNLIEKERQWLLCSNNDIVWVIGRRADERFKVTASTKKIARITWYR